MLRGGRGPGDVVSDCVFYANTREGDTTVVVVVVIVFFLETVRPADVSPEKRSICTAHSSIGLINLDTTSHSPPSLGAVSPSCPSL